MSKSGLLGFQAAAATYVAQALIDRNCQFGTAFRRLEVPQAMIFSVRFRRTGFFFESAPEPESHGNAQP